MDDKIKSVKEREKTTKAQIYKPYFYYDKKLIKKRLRATYENGIAIKLQRIWFCNTRL